MAAVADELLLVVKTNIAQAMAGLETVESKATGLGGGFKKGAAVAGKALVGIGVAAGAVGIASGKMAMDFEKDLATLQANAGFTADEIAAIKGPIMDTAGAFGVAKSDVADAAFMLKSAGMSAGDVEKNLDAIGKAANANLGDMGDLAQLSGVAYSNFGLDVAETMDVLTSAAGNAIVGPEEMGKAFSKLMGPSGAAGQSLQEMAENATVLTNAFGSAEFGATKYKAMLSKVLVPTEAATGALDKIGMSMEDFKKGMAEDMSGTLKDMQSQFQAAGVSDEEWIAAFFPDQESFTGAAAILGSESGEAIGEAIQNSTGALDEAFSVMAETGEFKMRQLKESALNLLMPIGDFVLEHVVPALTTFIDWLNSLGDSTSELGGVFSGFMDTAKAVWQGISDFIKPIVEEVAAFVQAEFGALKQWWDQNWPAIQETVEVVLGIIKRAWERFWPIIRDQVMNVWETIKGIVSGALDIIKGVIQTFVAIVTGDWDAAWEGIKQIVSGAWEVISSVVEGAWESLVNAIQLGLEGLKTLWDGFWSLFGEAVGAAWDGVVGMVQNGVNGVLGWIEGLVNGVITTINGLIDAYNAIPIAPDIGKVGSVSIPKLAQGGNVRSPGWAIVGEQGPELLELNRGAKVTPLSEPAPAPGGGGNQTIVLQVGDEEFARFVMDKTGLSNIRRARRTR